MSSGIRYCLTGILLLAGLLSWFQATAQPPTGEPPPEGVTELIVLLKAGPEHPTPESVVETIALGLLPSGGLGEGNPSRAGLMISRRASGRELEWNLANQDRPSARLQRYVVLGGYPPNANLEAIGKALSNNVHVENVGYNLFLTLSATPDDKFLGSAGMSPNVSQWGLHLMRFPSAWDWVKGHAAVGVIDNGIKPFHLDLVAFQATNHVGGNLRTHLSVDYKVPQSQVFDCDVDELQDPFSPGPLGHGVHVSGIVTATTNNAQGVAGACWMCSLLMVRATDQSKQIFLNDTADAINFLARNGAQIINLSAGLPGNDCGQTGTLLNVVPLCDAIDSIEEQGVLMVAAVGNDLDARVDFPAIEPEVLAVGGVEFSSDPGTNGYVFWQDGAIGSNYGPGLDLVAAVTTYSTVYTARNWIEGCGDAYGGLGTTNDGYGICTGTSMSAPHVAGEAALVRSANPLLSNDAVRDIVVSTASPASSTDSRLASVGLPDAEKAVKKSLGTVGGLTLANRLIPLFGFNKDTLQAHAYTTVPSFANALLVESYSSLGIEVPGYADFPGPPCEPLSQGCEPQLVPRATGYVFSTSTPPYPGAPPVAPLFRLSLDPGRPDNCNFQPGSITRFAYVTRGQDVEYLRNVLQYELDGIEGFVFESCDATCVATGAVPLQLLFNPTSEDFLLAPQGEGEVGYSSPANSGHNLPAQVGFVYPVVDTDFDHLPDGFERLVGTDPLVADSDCDSVTDGDELLVYNLSDPDPQNHGYGDPLLGPCGPIFRDGFESGDLTRWSQAVGAQ